jgi:hypothetical protein
LVFAGFALDGFRRVGVVFVFLSKSSFIYFSKAGFGFNFFFNIFSAFSWIA